MASPSTVFADRYELVSEIAHGGMADVYLARDSKLSRPVALKVLSPELSRDPAFVERFRREAQSAAGLNHPNIVGIFDWGQEHGTSFIVMEYVDGQTLRDLIRHEGTIAPGQVADIGADIAAALAFAHKNGVVHRDVKPGNVLITTAGQVKVTDFGIARASGDNEGLTRTGAVMGTATYFSPEQAQGDPVDGRSDVYSLGIVLYEMATGSPPFTGDSPITVAYKHVRERVVPPSQKLASIPPELERVIMTCLAKDPPDRYLSADDLRADLMRFRRGQAVVGTAVTAAVTTIPDTSATMVATPAATAVTPIPLSATQAPKKKARKGPVVAVIALLAVLIGVIGFLLFTQLGNDSSVGTVAVPSVVGQPEADAIAALKAKKLAVTVQRRANDTVPKGIVVRQDPTKGTKVDEGENVLLTVSDGAGSVKVPDVTGQTFEDAQSTLLAKGLKAERREEASDSVGVGLVTRTDPPAGATQNRDGTVVVFVSAGPAPVNVPNVEGMDQVEATQTLNNAAFKVQKSTAPNNTVPAGSVISTTPAAGTAAPRGSVVTINVSTGPDQVNVPNVSNPSSPMTQAQATNTLTNAGLDVRVVFVPSSVSNNGKVITQSPSAGTTVNRGTSVTITVGTGPGSTTSTT
ncbi:MAG: Stk1 family PASTA domain-containing Ser/Thr kinase [Acidimicrobiia bacterium]